LDCNVWSSWESNKLGGQKQHMYYHAHKCQKNSTSQWETYLLIVLSPIYKAYDLDQKQRIEQHILELRTTSLKVIKKHLLFLLMRTCNVLWKEHAKKCSEHLMLGCKEMSSSLSKHGIYKRDEINWIIKMVSCDPKPTKNYMP
jgi:hypothetical protein